MLCLWVIWITCSKFLLIHQCAILPVPIMQKAWTVERQTLMNRFKINIGKPNTVPIFAKRFWVHLPLKWCLFRKLLKFLSKKRLLFQCSLPIVIFIHWKKKPLGDTTNIMCWQCFSIEETILRLPKVVFSTNENNNW